MHLLSSQPPTPHRASESVRPSANFGVLTVNAEVAVLFRPVAEWDTFTPEPVMTRIAGE
jgi:hypothetical protein